MVRNEGERLKKVVVCSPVHEYFTVDDPHAHNITQPAHKERAVEQHGRLCTIMRDAGADVIDVPELVHHPNSVFTRDTCVCTPEGFIQLRMGLASRQGEGAWMARRLEEMDIQQYGKVLEPGTVEGGDIILAGRVVFIGRSMRSNHEGIEQVKILFEKIAYDVKIVDVPPPRLHIGGMMSMVGPRRILCCEELFPDGFFSGYEIIRVPAMSFISGNVICLSANTVIAEKDNTGAISALEGAGIHVLAIDLSEFVKGRGGPTCLIMPIERAGE
ncbi:amidinotransferase [candidate division WOR-3 bacterium]|nr:amidinotransferase [candidate division WOR-3 bacterium]